SFTPRCEREAPTPRRAVSWIRGCEAEMHAGEMERISLDPVSTRRRCLACARNVDHFDPQAAQTLGPSIRRFHEANVASVSQRDAWIAFAAAHRQLENTRPMAGEFLRLRRLDFGFDQCLGPIGADCRLPMRAGGMIGAGK